MGRLYCVGLFVWLGFIFGSEGYIPTEAGSDPVAFDWTTSYGKELPKASHALSASERGEASYDFTISVPPVLWSPSLSLHYASGDGFNREMPNGWSLGGLLEIHKPNEYAYIQDDEQVYILSGPISGLLKYDATKEGYVLWNAQVGQNAFASYQATSDKWTVRSSDGATYTLIKADDADVTSRWRIQSSADTHGNQYTCWYDSGYRLTSVTMGANTNTGFASQIRVTYGYTNRTDAYRASGSEGAALWDKVLNVVDVQVSSGGVWKTTHEYTLNLDEDGATVLLSGIVHRGYDEAKGSWDALPATTFTYSEYSGVEVRAGESAVSALSIVTVVSEGVAAEEFQWCDLLDWNGDGLDDFIASDGEGTWTVYFHEIDPDTGVHALATSAETFSGPELYLNEWYTFGKYSFQQVKWADINKDGYPDLLNLKTNACGSGTTEIWYGSGSGFETTATCETFPVGDSAAWEMTGFPDNGVAHRSMLDVDGDGWLDIVDVDPDTVEATVYFHGKAKGDGWNDEEIVDAPWLNDLHARGHDHWLGLSQTINNEAVSLVDDKVYISSMLTVGGFADVNGDGFTDYVVAKASNVGGTTNQWAVYLSKGKEGWADKVLWAKPPVEGLMYRSMGDPTSAGHFTDMYTSLQMQDVDGDGLPDMVVASELLSSFVWYKNIGQGFESTARSLPTYVDGYLSAASISATTIGDAQWVTHADHSRLMDFDHDGVWDYVHGSESNAVHYGDYPRPHRLITVETGSGLKTDVAYQPASSLYPSGVSTQEQHCAQVMDVVKTLTTTDEVSDQQTVLYPSYEYGYTDSGLFCGFAHYTREERTSISIDGISTERVGKEETFFDVSPYLTYGSILPTNHLIYSDADRNYSPELARGSEDMVVRYATDIVHHDFGTHDLPNYVYVTTYGEDGTGPTQLVVALFYDSQGRLGYCMSDVQDICLGCSTTPDFRMYSYSYAIDADNLVARINRETKSATDPLTGVFRDITSVAYQYDAQWSPTQAVYCADNYYNTGSISGQKIYIAYKRGMRGEVLASRRSRDGVLYDLIVSNTYTFGSALVQKTVNGLGHVVLNDIDYRGRLIASTDANGIQHMTTYDGLDRASEERIKDRAGTDHLVKTYSYETTVPFTTYEAMYSAGTVPETEHATVSDGAGHIFQTRSTHPETGGYVYVDQMSDLYGNLLWASHPSTNGIFKTHGASPDYYGVTYYDAFNQARESHADYENGIGPSTVTGDTSLESISTDEAGYETTTHYDIYGRVESIEKAGKTLASYAYDINNTLVSFTDANGNKTIYYYDAVGRLVKTVGPDSGVDVCTYEYGNMVTHTNLAGGQIFCQYDVLNRMTNQIISNPIYGPMTNRWVYDVGIKGKIDKQLDYLGYITYRYDALAYATNVTRHFTRLGPFNTNLTFRYTYDQLGRMLTKTYPSGLTLSNVYTYGALQQEFLTGGACLDYTYDAYRHCVGTSNTLGMVWRNHYTDTPLFLESQEFLTPALSLGRSYLWEENGLLKEKQNHAVYGTLPSERYAYDVFKQLYSIESYDYGLSAYTLSERYSYDDNGNISDQYIGGTNWTYVLGSGNQLNYRKAGILINSCTYDKAGSLKERTGPITYTYWYNGNRQLVKVNDNNGPIAHYMYGADNEIIAEARSNPTNPANFIVYFGDWRSDLSTNSLIEETAWGSYKNGVRRWYFKERDGSVVGTFSDSGTNSALKHFQSYGVKSIDLGENTDHDAFQQQEYKKNVNLYHMGARHMNPDMGQWLQIEPKHITGAPIIGSPYRYAANNPIMLADPTGFDPVQVRMQDEQAAELEAYCKNNPCIRQAPESSSSSEDASSWWTWGFLGSQGWAEDAMEHNFKMRMSETAARYAEMDQATTDIRLALRNDPENGFLRRALENNNSTLDRLRADMSFEAEVAGEEVGATSSEVTRWTRELNTELQRELGAGRNVSEYISGRNQPGYRGANNNRAWGEEGPSKGGPNGNLFLIGYMVIEQYFEDPCHRAAWHEYYRNVFKDTEIQDQVECFYPSGE